MEDIEMRFRDPQFKTTMLPRAFMRFSRQCIIFQVIGMTMYGLRSLDIIIRDKLSIKEVDQKR